MLYKCIKCSYTTNRLQNLERHYNRKYPCSRVEKLNTCNIEDTQNNNVITQNNNVITQNNDGITQNNDGITQNNDGITQNNYENIEKHILQDRKHISCSKCNKMFTRKDSMRRHEKKCEGIVDPRQCKTCLKVFTTTQGRWQHNKNVKCSPPSPSPGEQQQQQQQHVGDTTNNNITNNTNCHNTTNNITNNTLNNFYNITDEHIDKIVDKLGEKEYFRIAMNNVALGKYALPRTAATIYNNPNHPELQTIRKERRNDNLVDVYVGEDEWEKRVFNDVFKLIVRRVEEYYTKYFQHIDEKYKDVPVGSVRWKQLMRPIKTFGNSMLWYEGFHGDTIEGMGIELNYPDDDDPDIEKEREKRNKEMENLICERMYKETKTLMAERGEGCDGVQVLASFAQ